VSSASADFLTEREADSGDRPFENENHESGSPTPAWPSSGQPRERSTT